MQEIADAQGQGEQQGIIIVGGYPVRFADELCPENFKFKWPFPRPPPPWFKQELDGADLLTLAPELTRPRKGRSAPRCDRASLTRAPSSPKPDCRP
jgi:hypothetical protein